MPGTPCRHRNTADRRRTPPIRVSTAAGHVITVEPSRAGLARNG
ncbi:hypothetical protein C791_5842 [Amycolatopsis azurea DSM 43854]|uniref:Uncharacterized protein n=1 Tax=Amycolatopsis azurea DSM 43854 TaxID=1238180 RepID=M2NQD9_9PSEU|nr:hypothetical protein C791_5842 [Amycolatopsis azurea DSM 43854]